MDGVEWNASTETPDILNNAQSRFSVDVLIYSQSLDENAIAYYDYFDDKWIFLSRDVNFKQFKWRYLNNKLDKWQK